MVDNILSIFIIALWVTAVFVIVSHASGAAQVISAGMNGFSGIQRAAEGR